MVKPLPLSLQHALSILSRTDNPGTSDAQSACGEVARASSSWSRGYV